MMTIFSTPGYGKVAIKAMEVQRVESMAYSTSRLHFYVGSPVDVSGDVEAVLKLLWPEKPEDVPTTEPVATAEIIGSLQPLKRLEPSDDLPF